MRARLLQYALEAPEQPEDLPRISSELLLARRFRRSRPAGHQPCRVLRTSASGTSWPCPHV